MFACLSICLKCLCSVCVRLDTKVKRLLLLCCQDSSTKSSSSSSSSHQSEEDGSILELQRSALLCVNCAHQKRCSLFAVSSVKFCFFRPVFNNNNIQWWKSGRRGYCFIIFSPSLGAFSAPLFLFLSTVHRWAMARRKFAYTHCWTIYARSLSHFAIGKSQWTISFSFSFALHLGWWSASITPI